jgi:hypothetical protein
MCEAELAGQVDMYACHVGGTHQACRHNKWRMTPVHVECCSRTDVQQEAHHSCPPSSTSSGSAQHCCAALRWRHVHISQTRCQHILPWRLTPADTAAAARLHIVYKYIFHGPPSDITYTYITCTYTKLTWLKACTSRSWTPNHACCCCCCYCRCNCCQQYTIAYVAAAAAAAVVAALVMLAAMAAEAAGMLTAAAVVAAFAGTGARTAATAATAATRLPRLH